MKNDAIINGNKVILSDEDRKAGEAFHRRRLAFAWVNGQLTFNTNENDDRDHQHWLLEDFGISVEEWETLPRGYMMEDRIQLFIGSDFRPLDTSIISVTDFNNLLHTHATRYNSESVKVYNGVKIGKVGEIWPPMECLGTFDTI